MQRVMHRWARLGEARALRQWVLWTRERAERRATMRAVATRWQAGKLGAGWRSLREHALRRREQRALLRRCAARWAHQSVGRALRKLRDRARTRKSIRETVARATAASEQV